MNRGGYNERDLPGWVKVTIEVPLTGHLGTEQAAAFRTPHATSLEIAVALVVVFHVLRRVLSPGLTAG